MMVPMETEAVVMALSDGDADELSRIKGWSVG